MYWPSRFRVPAVPGAENEVFPSSLSGKIRGMTNLHHALHILHDAVLGKKPMKACYSINTNSECSFVSMLALSKFGSTYPILANTF